MKKEQRIKLNQLEKAMHTMIRNNAKRCNSRVKQDTVFCADETMFLSIYIGIGINENCCVCACQEIIKPLWTDDLLWDILGCSENKNEPLSLRAFGAFTFYGLKAYTETMIIETWSEEELEICVEKYVNDFIEHKKDYNIAFFEQRMSSNMYHGDLYNLLNLIHKEKYSDAYNFIDNMDSDRFIIGNNGLRKLAKLYCKKMKIFEKLY